MDRLWSWLEERFVDLSAEERAGWTGAWLCVMALTIHQVIFVDWMLEDAAITFSYSRNAAIGEGFVSWIGGERVEGFSNPSWTLLLMVGRMLGISPWIGAKLGGVVFGGIAVLAAWRWTRTLVPHPWSLVAPLFLALWPPFALWCASGLENPLFVAALAVAGWLTVREANGAPGGWSGLAWGVLAITRPEAALYAAVGAVWTGLFRLPRHGVATTLRWTGLWLLGFSAVFGSYKLWAWWYFSWPLPNTYYAKLGESRFFPWGWDKRGWVYFRRYHLETTAGFWSWLFAVSLVGLHTRARRIGVVALVLWVLALVAPDFSFAPWDVDWPERANQARILALVGGAGLLSLATLGREGAQSRGLAWWMLLVAAFFSVYSGGDWARGFRWGSMAAVPTGVLLADGLWQFRRWAEEALPRGRMPLGATFFVLAVPLIASVIYSGWVRGRTETSPFNVQMRAAYMQGVQERLDIDRPILLEVDQGAHMWFSGFELVDMAGLTDVPMARHPMERDFTDQYVYAERQPDFAHVHGGWARKTKLDRNREFREYVEIPGYAISRRTAHVGNHVHRRHITQASWDGPEGRRALFEDGIRLEGWDVPTGEASQGGTLWLEVAHSRPKKEVQDSFRTWVFLASGDALQLYELPPAYDWIPVDKWRSRREVIVDRHRLPIPADFPEGPATLGLVHVSEGSAGTVLGTTQRPSGLADGPPRVAQDELRWDGALTILSPSAGLERSEQRIGESLEAAADDDCVLAEARWQLARRYHARSDDWQDDARARIAGPIAQCWARRGANDVDPELAAEHFREARRWDHNDAQVRALALAFADTREAAGDTAAADGDEQAAYDAWWQALRADPSRSWVRHRAEEARTVLLDLER